MEALLLKYGHALFFLGVAAEGEAFVYPRGSELPRIALAMTLVHTEGGLMQLLLKR